MRERLYRSRDERVLFGVAGGIGDWLNIDPTLVRIVFALLVITGGFGFLLYIVLALVIPEEPAIAEGATGDPAAAEAAPVSGGSWTAEDAARRAARREARGASDGRGVVIFGSVLILIGAWFLLRRFLPDLDGDLIFPVLLIGIGGVLLAGAMRGSAKP